MGVLKIKITSFRILSLLTPAMASRIVKSPAVQTTAKRQFAAQASIARTEKELLKAEPLKVSTLPNGLTVASLENHSPVTTVGVVIKAGSRNEGYDNAGVSHALRIAAGMATKKNTAFGLCRNLQQVGGSMSCTQGREHTLYAVQTTRDVSDIGVEYLTDSVSNSVYKPWEVERSTPRLKLELATRSPATKALELLHQASFRSGLGNGLFCPDHKVGSHGTAQLLSDVYTLMEDPLQLVENMGVQLLVSGDVMPVEKYPEIIKGISTADVQAAAKKLAGSKLAMGAVGNLSSVPHLDSL